VILKTETEQEVLQYTARSSMMRTGCLSTLVEESCLWLTQARTLMGN